MCVCVCVCVCVNRRATFSTCYTADVIEITEITFLFPCPGHFALFIAQTIVSFNQSLYSVGVGVGGRGVGGGVNQDASLSMSPPGEEKMVGFFLNCKRCQDRDML